MFKNLSLYRVTPGWQLDFAAAEAGLQSAQFLPCGASQALSSGWVPPRGQAHGALLESVQGQWLVRLRFEQKLLPASVVKERAKELALAMEESTGRAPGKKLQKELREQAAQELLPRAFSRTSAVTVWLDTQAGLLMLDTGSAARAEEAITQLVKCWPGFGVSPLHTQVAPATAMATWLLEADAPAGFSLDRDCELKAADDSRAAVRYARHALDIDEVRAHVAAGKMPTRLALTWGSRVAVVLTDALQLKRIKFDDVVFESAKASAPEEEFDTDVALSTGELAGLIRDLIEALGGEAQAIGGSTATEALASSESTASTAAGKSSTTDDAPPWEV